MEFYSWLLSIDKRKLEEFWLPSRPETRPTETEMRGLKNDLDSFQSTAEYNMVSEASDIDGVELLEEIIRRFQGTRAETLAKRELEKLRNRGKPWRGPADGPRPEPRQTKITEPKGADTPGPQPVPIVALPAKTPSRWGIWAVVVGTVVLGVGAVALLMIRARRRAA